MGLLIKGISKLSELEIDADKVWVDVGAVPHGIVSIKEVAQYMARGDLVVRGDTVLIRIQPSTDGYVLTSAGLGKIPVWAPAGGHLNFYFPELIALSHNELVVPVDRAVPDIAGPITRVEKYTCGDAPGDNIKQMTPTIALTNSKLVVPVDKTYDKSPATIGRDISTSIVAAISETWAGAHTDETLAARSGALNDMNLNPMTPHVDDLYYFGFDRVFPRMWVNLSTPGVGNWANQYEYWNGATWVACIDEDDQSSSFISAAGWKRIQWTPQLDWATCVVWGLGPFYWVRSRTTVFINPGTKPLGAQVFCCLVT